MAASNHTHVQAHSSNGSQLSFQHTSTDSPVLPAANLAQLKEIDPSLVRWVVEQTEKEGAHRRREETKVSWFILLERLSGVIAGAFVAVVGLALGTYLILQGHDWAGVGLCGAGLASIVSVLVARHQASAKPEPKPRTTRKRK